MVTISGHFTKPGRPQRHAMEPDEHLPTRRSLISRLRTHEDEKSWREFFDRYWKLIYSFAIKCGCTESEAEEVVQETIISFSRGIPEYQYKPEVCSFKGWLLHITNWRIIDQLRRRRRPDRALAGPLSLRDAEMDDLPDGRTSDLDALWENEWRQSILGVAMERLKHLVRPDHYQVFHMHFVKELPLARIAEILGISRPQAYLIKHRVAARLRKEVKALERQTR